MLREARLLAGARLRDLTISNPTSAGIPYPIAAIQRAFADERILRYEPSARGPAPARAAVAADCARRGAAISPDDVVLCASTSEAYSWLFKLLCDPGDAVLAPRPSYPLFEYLAALDGIELVGYDLTWEGSWRVDRASIEAALAATPRARAILSVSPNNPTGTILTAAEHAHLDALAARHGLALVVDEVFADYTFAAAPDPGLVTLAAAAAREALTFSLGGLSKSAGLPQLKLGWIIAGGPPALRSQALDRLELVADSYLSAATPTLVAAPRLLGDEIAGTIRAAILERVRTNRSAIAARLRTAPHVELLAADGGWSAVLRLPGTRTDEERAEHLLEHHDTVVHPGYFYDFPPQTYLVLSLLGDPATLADGLEAVLAE